MDLFGGWSNDTLTGTGDGDVILSGPGSDSVDGGAGNDTISDLGGPRDTLIGGSGDDVIDYWDRYVGSNNENVRVSLTISGGDGADRVTIATARAGTAAIDLGAGDDYVQLGNSVAGLSRTDVSLTLGTGIDVIDFSETYGRILAASFVVPTVRVNDFTVGNQGDVIDLSSLLMGLYLHPSPTTVFPYSNPFASSHIRLIQDGADTVVRIDIDGFQPGTGTAYTRDVLRLVNVSAASLTAHNFAGFAPSGARNEVAGEIGTSGDDILITPAISTYVDGGDGNDYILGSLGSDFLLGDNGNDTIIGRYGSDRLYGQGGDDTIIGGHGSALLDGGDGNDVLSDTDSGSDTIVGGAGNDRITVFRAKDDNYLQNLIDTQRDSVTISAGDGDDQVSIKVDAFPFLSSGRGNYRVQFSVDLGAGNDVFTTGNIAASGSLTTGTGADVVIVQSWDLSTRFGLPQFVVTDFTPGNGGDRLDLSTLLSLASGWDYTTNPFATGHLRLEQAGDGVHVLLDYDGSAGGSETLPIVVLAGVTISSLTAYNFSGYAPDQSPLAGVTLNGSALGDQLIGFASGDTINGLGGDDRIDGRFGNDTIDGGDGNDTIEGGFGNDSILGGIGNDVLSDTGQGSDVLSGGDGNDTITVRHTYAPVAETTTVLGGAGDDVVELETMGATTVDLGAGNDRLQLVSVPGPVTVTLGSGSDYVGLNTNFLQGPLTITDFQTGSGGDFFDASQLFLIWDSSTNLTQRVAANTDQLFNMFGSGRARLIQSGANTLLQVNTFQSNFQEANYQTVVTFANTTATAFTKANFGQDPFQLTAIATSDGDALTGGAGMDVLRGLDGDDLLSGLGGDDLLDGGNGNDTLLGGDGNDELRGGNGNDSVQGGDGNDVLLGNGGADTLDGGVGDDVIGIDWSGLAVGGSGNDTITVQFIDYVSMLGTGRPAGSVSAGMGDDLVVINGARYGIFAGMQFNVDLGDGSDHIITDYAIGALTLGAGSDRVTFSELLSYNPDDFVIADFQPGNGGDTFDMSFFAGYLRSPFSDGLASLVQDGSDVLLKLSGWVLFGTTTIRFKNTTLSQFTAYNFDGYDLTPKWMPQVVINANYTVANGQTLNLTNPASPDSPTVKKAFVYASPDGSAQFVNHGTVDIKLVAPSGGGTGFEVTNSGTTSSQSLFHNASDGRFLVTSETFSVTGFYNNADPFSFRNDGEFTVQFTGPYEYGQNIRTVGIFDESPSGARSYVNTGTINVLGGTETIGVRLQTAQASLANSGTINVSGPEYAVAVYMPFASGEQLNNQGTITAITPLTSPYYSIGVMWQPVFNGNVVIRNSGTINADIALRALDTTPYGENEQVINSGTINGAVLLEDGNDTVSNSGTIDGRTLLGSGEDLYDGATGQHHGSVEGGLGNDTLLGGAGDENLFGDSGNDSISAGGGNDYVEGGQGSDWLDGGAGNDMISYWNSILAVTADLAAGSATSSAETDTFQNFEAFVGGKAADSILGAGIGELLAGFQANDTIDGRGGNDTLIGGSGDDLLTGGTGNDLFVFDAGDGRDAITDFAAGDRIEIYGYTGYQSLVQQGADLKIVLSAADSITLRNTTAAVLGSSNLSFTAAPSGYDFAPLLDEPIVSNSDLVISQGTLLKFGDTQDITIRFSTLSNTAIAMGGPLGVTGVGLYNAGSIRFSTAAPVTTSNAVAATSLLGGDTSSWLVNGSTGSIIVTAAHGKAVASSGMMSVWNYGTLSVRALDGDASAVFGLQPQFGTVASTFVNRGTISVEASAEARAVDIGTFSASPDGLFNYGSITVHGGLESHGLEFDMNRDGQKMVNSGTITVTDDTAAIDSAGLWFNVNALVSVWNSGTITADYAVRVADLYTYDPINLHGVSFYNTGTLNGLVRLSRYDDLLVNTQTINGNVRLESGNDLFDGRLGLLSGTLDGGDGNDTLLAGNGSQTILGGFGDDILSGGTGNDTLTGGAGIDSFRFASGFGVDTISDFQTGAAHDFIDVSGYGSYQSLVQQGSDVLITFSASDKLLVQNVTVTGLSGAIRFGAADIAAQGVPAAPTPPPPPDKAGFDPGGGQTLTGGTGPDALTGGTGPDSLSGGNGNDTLDGGAGADTMSGGPGNDTFMVDDFADVVTEASGEGTDTVQTGIGTGASISTLYYLPDNVENLVMTNAAGGQVVAGNALSNLITGTGANDVMVLGDVTSPYTSTNMGNDTVNAGGGNDFLFFNRTFDANDVVDGGAGYDTVGLLGPVYTNLVLGANSLTGVEQFSMYSSGDAANPNSYKLTTHDANVAAGQQLLVTAMSLQANETLNFDGSAEANGKFLVFGGRGADTIVGGAGNDRIIAGDGADRLTGGAGNDVFQFNAASNSTPAARDTITDFTSGDKIDLWFIDANVNAAGNQRFTFIGQSAFGNVAGQLRAVDQGAGNWLVEGDTNGDGLADLSIAVTITDGHSFGLADLVI